MPLKKLTLTLLLLLCGLCRCSGASYQALVVTVDQTAVSALAITTLRFTATLDGQAAQSGPQSFAPSLTPFTLVLPAGLTGTLTVVVDGLAANQAVLAAGTQALALTGQEQALTIRLAQVFADPTTLSFAAPVYAGPGGAQLLGSGDFNRDQKLDLVVTPAETATVDVLLNQGQGTYPATAPSYPTGELINSLAVGDANGDGVSDVLVADVEAGAVLWLRGEGDGTLATGTSALANAMPGAQILGAGSLVATKGAPLDLVISTGMGVAVLIGKGDGTFTPLPAVGIADQIVAGALGDVDCDGRLDLVVSHSTGVRVLKGDGAGGLSSGADLPGLTYGFPNLAVADINGDLKADLVATDGSGGVSVLLGNGDGTFQAARSFATGSMPGPLLAGDVDGDGKLDLVIIAADASMDGAARVSTLRNTMQ